MQLRQLHFLPAFHTLKCMKIYLIVLLLIVSVSTLYSQTSRVNSAFKIARLKYSGGGDWYNGPMEEPDLLTFVRQNTLVDVDPVYEFVDVASDKFFSYPFIFMTGHGSILFSDLERKRIRTYLENGGFIYADDDYGMDKFFRREIKKIFPEQDLVELPFSYGLYHCVYDFPYGPPKTHEHNGKPPQGFGIFHNGRLVLYYTYESNPSDGWDPPDVHGDPPEKREEALRFGTNLVVWALTH